MDGIFSDGFLVRRREKFCVMHKTLLLEMFRRFASSQSELGTRLERIRLMINEYNDYYWYLIDDEKFKQEFVGASSSSSEVKDGKAPCVSNGAVFDIATQLDKLNDVHWFFREEDEQKGQRLQLYNGMQYVAPFVLSRDPIDLEVDKFFKLHRSPNSPDVDAYELLQFVASLSD